MDLVNAPPDQKFKGGFGNSEVKTLSPVAVKFLGNDKPADFALRLGRQRFEHNFFVERGKAAPFLDTDHS